MRGDVGAPPGAARVPPPVVEALELEPLVESDGQPDAAMETPVVPHVDDTVVGPPDREFTAEELGLVDVSIRRVVAASDREPATGSPGSSVDAVMRPESRRR